MHPLLYNGITASAIAPGVQVQPLTITGDFDAGNLDSTNSGVANPVTATPTVTIVPRATTTTTFTNWRQFYLRLDNANGKTPLFRLDATDSALSIASYNDWRPWFSTDNKTWTRWPSAPTQDLSDGLWEFQLGTAFTADTVWVAFYPGYPVARIADLRMALETLHPGIVQDIPSSDVNFIADTLSNQTDEQGRTIPGQPLYSFGIWDDTISPPDGFTKQNIVITCGIHGCEQTGDYMMEGFLRALADGSPESTELLSHFHFYVYAVLNPMGRWGGHVRGQWDPADLTADTNRDFVDLVLESSNAIVTALNADHGVSDIVFSLDFHSDPFETGAPPAFWLYAADADPTYHNAFSTAMQTVDATYVGIESTLPENVSLVEWLRLNLFASITQAHVYLPEFKELEGIASQAALEAIGADFAAGLHALLQAHPEQLGFASIAPSPPQVLDVTETSFGSAATSHPVNMPATVNADELLFMMVAIGSNTTVATPSGWALTWNIATSDIFSRFAAFTKTADGTEGGTTVDVVTSGAIAAAAQVYRIDNWSQFEPTATFVSAGGVNPDPASHTASWGSDNNLWIAAFGAGDDDETVSAYPANYTDGIDTISGGGVDNGATVGSAVRVLVAATENPGTFTITGSETWHAGLFVIRPAV